MNRERTILHSDCNSFYVSVELVFHPELRGRPVSVGGDSQERHGIILASSPEAKKCGVRTGEPLWQARQKCAGLIILPPNFSKYTEFSRRVRQIYLEYTDMVEPFGLDEAWLDVTGSTMLFGSGLSIAQRINERVKKETGITVSVGVSFNKIFAKLGSDYRKPDAVTEITRENYKSIVYPLPVGDLLYVGDSTRRKLANFGIHTIGQLADFPAELLRAKLGKCADMLVAYARGEDSSPVRRYSDETAAKSIGNSTTTVRSLRTRDEVCMVLLLLADSVGRRLREAEMYCSVVSVGVRDEGLSWTSHQCRLERPTDITRDIFAASVQLFDRSFDVDKPLRSLGITLSGLSSSEGNVQQSIFIDESRRSSMHQLDLTLDRLKSRYGTNSVCPALLYKDRRLTGFGRRTGQPTVTEEIICPQT